MKSNVPYNVVITDTRRNQDFLENSRNRSYSDLSEASLQSSPAFIGIGV